MADSRLVDALERLVVGAIGLTTAALAASDAAAELTLVQWRALVVVVRGEGARVGEIGARIGLSLPSASRLVRRLERRGLVTTERSDRDRRATIVRATPAGVATWSRVVEQRRTLIATLLDAAPLSLPDLPADLEVVAAAFGAYA